MQDDVQFMTDTVYAFICRYIRESGGLSPSQREISDGCFVSKGAVSRYLDRLEMQGRIVREEGKARTIRLQGGGECPKQTAS
jgi:DNA-binding MarR family transcriptional regulator